MRRPLCLSAAAEIDAALAAGWYDAQVPGLGNSFIANIDATSQRIAEHPEMYPVAFRDVRRAIVHRFPYAVIYRILPATIEVLGVLPCRADPQAMMKRIAATPRFQ